MNQRKKKEKKDYLKYNKERLDFITELNKYESNSDNPNVKGDLKERLNTYFRQHSDVGVSALKKETLI